MHTLTDHHSFYDSMASTTPSLEEEVFGPHWKTKMCKPDQVIVYFERRFGLGRSAYYDILAPRLPHTSLAPENHGGRLVGQGMFCIQVVEECDRLQEEAMARAKRPRDVRAAEQAAGRQPKGGKAWPEES